MSSSNEPFNEITVNLIGNLSKIEQSIISISKILLPAILTPTSLITVIYGFVANASDKCNVAITPGNSTALQDTDSTVEPLTAEAISFWCNLTANNEIISQICGVINVVFAFSSIAFVWLVIKQERIFKTNNDILISRSESVIKENCALKQNNEQLSVQLEHMSAYQEASLRSNTASTSTAYPSPINIV